MTQPTINRYMESAQFVELGSLPPDFRKWNRTLQIIHDVSRSIADDIYLAADTYRPVIRSNEAVQLLESCLYYREAFLHAPLAHAELQLRPYIGELKEIGRKDLTMGAFLAQVRLAVAALDRAIYLFRNEYTKDKWGSSLPIPTRGSRVPTASPNQLLFEFLLKAISPSGDQSLFLRK